MIRFITVIAAAGFFTALCACSGIPDLSAKKDDAKSTDAAAEQDQPCSGADCESPAEDNSFGTLGLASYCEYSKEDAKGCFVCTPRELPQKMCVDVDTDFDPAKSCEYDLDIMTCKVKTDGEDFDFDFSEQSQIEKIYSKMPFLLLGAKVLIGGKLKDNPVAKDLIFAAFDALIKHKKAAFSNGDVGPLFDELGVLVKTAKPEFDDAKITAIKDSMKKTAILFTAAYADGKLDDADFLNFAHGLVSALPEDMVGTVLEELDVDKILQSLQASGNQDIIDEIINSAGGAAAP